MKKYKRNFDLESVVKVSVVISTYTKDRWKDVLKCIESLHDQTLKPYEILIVLDPIEDLMNFYRDKLPNYVKIVESDGFGLSKARNKGILESKGDIIAFIDDDAWAGKYWLERMVKNYLDKDVYCVGGKIIPVFENSRPKWLPEELDWIVGCTYKGMPEVKSEIRNPIGANMSFRREAFEIAGLFREEVGRYGKKLLSGEEAEFAMRLKKILPNAKIIYDPSAVVYHRVPKSRTKLRYALKRAYYEGYSKAMLSEEYELKTERCYAIHLLKEIFKKIVNGKLLEVIGISLVIFVTLLGWLAGRFKISQEQ